MALRACIAIAVLLLAAAASAPPARGDTAWSWPVQGEVLTQFRNGSDPYASGQHRGIDIAAASGQPVVAAASGRVVFAGTAGWSGLAVTVRTSNGRYDTSYLHLSAAGIREGADVSRGERIGAVGTTGRRSLDRPHLHFSIRDAGSRHAYHDPLGFLPQPPGARRPDAPPAPVPAPAPVRAVPDAAPAPRAVRAPAHRRVPAGRRVRVPSGRRFPAPGRAPQPSPAHGPQPAPGMVPAPSPAHVPAARPVANPGEAPALGVAPGSAPAPAAALGREAPTAAPTRSEGPNLGWAIACAGLLLAAAFVGGTEEGRAAAGRGRARLAAFLRPLVGRP